MTSVRRLKCIQDALAPSTEITGTLTLGDIFYLQPHSPSIGYALATPASCTLRS